MERRLTVPGKGNGIDHDVLTLELTQSRLHGLGHLRTRRQVRKRLDALPDRLRCPSALAISAVKGTEFVARPQQIDTKRSAQPSGDKRPVDQILFDQPASASV